VYCKLAAGVSSQYKWYENCVLSSPDQSRKMEESTEQTGATFLSSNLLVLGVISTEDYIEGR
jgi:hypothetical protein